MTGIGRPEKVNDDATAVAFYTIAALLLVCVVVVVIYYSFENTAAVPVTTAEAQTLIFEDSGCT
ncbi:MAG: hypothetical protein JMN27_09255 [gamma proteobacterium endosymbiont of Lamellibrachia anaximandri]|nr:hypothetical protein [gamma proteobacterium endosymbiont of Lamellibrachia anaximandri]MBL3534007.1 hypothetical protein [gamma proteobacterium endosymbiont of Lamellibrachia anaximandri]MBL3600930.1 hypothetical protein [gamma proteobacterium endosymbiont of Lamellibrachia anaximandri]